MSLFGIGTRYRAGFRKKFISSPTLNVLRKRWGHRLSNSALFNKKVNHRSLLYKMKHRRI